MFEMRQDDKGKWKWAFENANGQITVISYLFPDKDECIESLKELVKACGETEIKVKCYPCFVKEEEFIISSSG